MKQIDIRELYPPEEKLDELMADVDVHGEHDRATTAATAALSFMDSVPKLFGEEFEKRKIHDYEYEW